MVDVNGENPNEDSGVDPDLVREASRILVEMRQRDLDFRLLGGIGIRLALGDRFDTRLERSHNDIDFVTTKRDGSKVEEALAELGWEPDRQFNAINGARRLLFTDPATGHKIDGFVDRFEMCHSLPLTERFEDSEDVLPPADLLMTKLQIIELNAKDLGDAYALLLGFPTAPGPDPQTIETGRIALLASRDWGLQHTLELNFTRMLEGLEATDFEVADRDRISSAIDAITDAMDAHPKSRAWKLRARIGERKKWYDEPEEID